MCIFRTSFSLCCNLFRSRLELCYNVVCMLRLTMLHIHQQCMKRLITYIMRLSRKNREGPSIWSKIDMREQREDIGFKTFMVIRWWVHGEDCVCGRGWCCLNLLSSSKEKAEGFLIKLLRYGTEGEERRVRLKSCLQLNIDK